MMKNILCYLFLITISISCNNGSDTSKAKLPTASGKQQTAVFAGGCFWSIQEAFLELKGVSKATSGYTGGTKEDPTYEEVGTEQTGHAEAVQVIYDPAIISFAQLTEAFFHMHDPTQLNRQGPDIGTSYRSIAFYSNPSEKKQIEEAIRRYNSTMVIDQEVVTAVEPLTIFYPAEKYHQNYFRTHPNDAYIESVCGPKVMKLRAAMPQLLKDEFK
jgi:peptide-methionine (S)-S-oxide reductase